MNLEQFVPTLFEHDKKLPVGRFWKDMKEYAVHEGQPEVTGEMYRAVAKMFSEGHLGLNDGCYYLREGETRK